MQLFFCPWVSTLVFIPISLRWCCLNQYGSPLITEHNLSIWLVSPCRSSESSLWRCPIFSLAFSDSEKHSHVPNHPGKVPPIANSKVCDSIKLVLDSKASKAFQLETHFSA